MSGGIARQLCRQLSTACHTEPRSFRWTQQDLERGSALMTPASPPRCSIEAPIRPRRQARVDDAAAGSDLVATSYALAKALEREGADVVLFGQQAGDSDGAVLWAAVADRLRLPVVSQAAEITHADGKLTVKRQTEFGYDVIEAPLPALVAVSDAINEPRYPSLKGIMGAKSKPQEAVTLADLGIEADRAGEQGSRTEVYALNDPPARGDSKKIDDDGSAAQAIFDFLAEKRLV